MNDREKLRVDVISGMDEEIIERNTQKKIELEDKLSKKQKQKRPIRWIPIVSAAAAFLFLFAAVLLLIPDKKQVPIYQGMTVSHTYTAGTGNEGGAENLARLTEQQGFFGSPVLSIRAQRMLWALNTETGTDLGLLSETDSETETETETEKPSTLTDFSAKRYYATPGQDIYITIHFSNPDKFEILSFTLNGEKFSSYMFEAGSDMEHLVLKQNVGNECGMKEFTIDAIKYVDGTQIKDVRMDGERTVEVGVYNDALPTTQASVKSTGYFDTTLSVSLTELAPTLLRLSEGKLRAALYLGEERVATRDILPEEIGASLSIPFGNLLSGTEYRYAIEATFDKQQGEGVRTYVLKEQSFHTKRALTVTGTADTETATFTIEWAADYPQKSFTLLELLESDGTLVRQIKPEEPVEQKDSKDPNKLIYLLDLSELLSNHKYTLAVTYPNGETVNTVIGKAVTKEKTVPQLDCAENTVDQTSFSFQMELNDPDGICTIESILLLNADKEPIGTYDTSVRSFSDLLSGTIYYVQINYSYDLNDGSGRVSQSHPFRFATKAKTVPQYTISSAETTQTSVTFDIEETDPDSIGTITKIELLRGEDAPILASDLSAREFRDLLSDNDYTLRVTYAYDLNKGNGVQTRTVEKRVRTQAKALPTYAVRVTESTQTSVSFDIEETDPDDIGMVTKIELLYNDVVVQTANSVAVRRFNGLEANREYTLRVSYGYNLNNGKGTQIGKTTHAAATLARTISITDVEIQGSNAILPGDAVTVIFSVQNPDGVELTHATVNGSKVSTTKISDTRYRLTYTSASQGGAEFLRFTNLSYSVASQNVSQTMEYVSTAKVIVRGKVSVASITLPRDGDLYAGDDQTATVVFKGSEGYSSMQVLKMYEDTGYGSKRYTEVPLTKVNDTTYTFLLPTYDEYFSSGSIFNRVYFVESAVCMIEQTQAEVTMEKVTDIAYTIMGSAYRSVIDIRTPEQLQNMQSGRAYRLVNDIDLDGFSWQPYDFEGVLFGNGYKIKNLDLYRYYASNEIVSDAGMFGTLSGYIKDLVLENAYVTIEKDGEMNHHDFGDEPIGLLAGYAGGMLRNCSVKGSMTVISERISYEVFIGGMVGRGHYSCDLILVECSFEGTVNCQGDTPAYDGYGVLVGRVDLSTVFIRCDSSKGQFLHNGSPWSPWL